MSGDDRSITDFTTVRSSRFCQRHSRDAHIVSEEARAVSSTSWRPSWRIRRPCRALERRSYRAPA